MIKYKNIIKCTISNHIIELLNKDNNVCIIPRYSTEKKLMV